MTTKRPVEEIPFVMAVSVAQDILIQEVDEESVLLNLQSELYLGLNKSGSEILAALTNSKSIEDAYQSLLGKYEIEPQQLRTELTSFLKKLLEQGLVVLIDPNSVSE